MALALRRLARKIDAFQERFGRTVSWLMLAMVVVVFTDVVLRYAFAFSTVFTQEMEWHLFGIVYLLAAGYVMLWDEHIRVDIIYSKLSRRKRAWIDFLFLFIFFFPSCILVLVTTWPFVKASFLVNEGSPDPGGVPARWLLKGVILLGFALLAVQGVSEAIKNFFWAMGWEEPEARQHEIH